MTPEEGLPPLPQRELPPQVSGTICVSGNQQAGLQQANVAYNPRPQLQACEYGASDMREYGLACFRAGLEKAATICEEHYGSLTAHCGDPSGDEYAMRIRETGKDAG